MTRKRENIICPRCQGNGCFPLPTHLDETLAVLRSVVRRINAAELGRMMNVSGEAMANRLRELESHGLAVKVVDGRQNLWRAK